MNLFDEVNKSRAAAGKPAAKGSAKNAIGDKAPEKAPTSAATGGGVAAKATAADVVKKTAFVIDLKPGTTIDEVFYCSEAAVRLGARSKYLHAQFLDKTGAIVVRMWDVDDSVLQHVSPGSYVRCQASVESYQDKPQLVVRKIRKMDPADLHIPDFLPASTFDPEKMTAEFWDIVAKLPDGEYKLAIQAVFRTDAIWQRFRLAPAASMNHHAWIHGLLEHTLSIMRSVVAYHPVHPELKLDLLMAGVAFHDIGKAWELDAKPGLSYTDEGMLLGHINIGFMVVDNVLKETPVVSAKARMLIGHMILSHHGTREFGSPVTPMFPEAVAVHHLECLDAKLQGLRTAMDHADPAQHWTPKVLMAENNRVFKDY